MKRYGQRGSTSHPASWPQPWGQLASVAEHLVEQHGAHQVTAMLVRLARELRRAPTESRRDVLERANGGPLGALLEAVRGAPAVALTGVLIPTAVGLAAAAAVGTRRREHPTNGNQPTGDLLERSLEIPIRDHRLGPLSRARQRRAVAVLGVLEIAGLCQLFTHSPQRHAAGLSAMVPGGGFLYTKDPALFALSVAVVATSLVIWVGTANHLVTPLAWLGAGVWARQRAKGGSNFAAAKVIVPLAVAGVAEGMRRKYRKDYQRQVESAKSANTLLKTVTPPLRGKDRPDIHVGPELTDDELAITRTLVDVALQDPDDWSHFDILEQFQPAAVRYQINQIGYALAQQQYARTPAFHGYLSEAQRRLIERCQQRKVWSYWFLENLWGNLELNPDPIRKQNVMLSGWFGLQVAAYQSASGDMRYSEPGSIRFRWSKSKEFEYSLTSICAAMARDLSKSPWGLMVCEPNWLYTYCNTTAGNCFVIHDRMHDSDFWPKLRDPFVRGMEEEMTRVDGLMHAFKSTRVGLAAGKEPGPSTFLRPLAPHLADRSWALLQAGGWVRDDDAGDMHTVLRDDDVGFDFGTYEKNPVLAYGLFMECAREVGDEERFQVAWDELQETHPPTIDNGRMKLRASLLAHAFVARGLFSRKSGWLDLVTEGLPEAWREGPLLRSVPYEQVLVARAVTDGRDLEFVLRGYSGHKRAKVELSRLKPGASYDISGAVQKTLTAPSDGTASIEIIVDNRAEVRVALASENIASRRSSR